MNKYHEEDLAASKEFAEQEPKGPIISVSEIKQFVMQNEGEWAEINVTPGSGSGSLSINSSFRALGHHWRATGGNFYKFISGCDMYYMGAKLGYKTHVFDLQATVKRWKQDLLRSRREEEIDEIDARGIYNAITHASETHSKSMEELARYDCLESIMELYGGDWPPEEDKVNPSLQRFWDVIWKPFIEYVKKEGYAD